MALIQGAKFKLGDVVGLNTNEMDSNFFYLLSPYMVITEIIKENEQTKKLFNEQTGDRIADLIKYKCMWYSHKTGEFTERFFYESHLEIKSIFSIISPKYADIVILKTCNIESNRTISKDFKNQISFLPPKMSVIGFEIENNVPNKFNPKDGSLIREVSTKKVKCMWYNPFINKFSEQFFIEEALIIN